MPLHEHPGRRDRDRVPGRVGHCGAPIGLCSGGGMCDANSSKPAAGRLRRSQRPAFSYQIRLIGGEAGRRVEREQVEAIAEVLRQFAANPSTPAVVRDLAG